MLKTDLRTEIWTRTQLIQFLLHRMNYRSYLEIGLGSQETFQAIHCLRKVGVDPDPARAHGQICLTSDDYFRRYDERFDLVFIDGLHEAEQANRDIQNALSITNPNGCIVLHDCSPTNEAMQRWPRPADAISWTGNVWRAWVGFRQNCQQSTYTVDIDFGCGVIEVGEQMPVSSTTTNMEFETFALDRRKLLNLISVSRFVERVTSRKQTVLRAERWMP